MSKRRILMAAAVVNTALLAAIALGAWRWAECRAAALRARDAAAEEEAAEGRAVKLVAAEPVTRDAEDLPGIWVVLNEHVASEVIASHLSLIAGNRELKRTLERSSPDGKRLLFRFAEPFGSGNVTVRLSGGAASPAIPRGDSPPALPLPLRPGELTVGIQAQMALLHLRGESPADGAPSIEAMFTRPPDCEKAAAFLSVEPPVAFRAEPFDEWRYDRGLRLRGPFEPGGIYTVTFAAGLPPQTGGDALRKTVVRQVQVPDREPLLSYIDNGRYLSPRGRMTVRARAVNSVRCTARLRRVLANNVVFFGLREEDRLPYHYGWRPYAAMAGLDQEMGARDFPLAGRRNEAETIDIHLRDIVPGLGAGIYLLELESPSGAGEQRVIVVSDLGVSLRLGERQMAAWVVSAASGLPAEGVGVTLWSVKNERMASAPTVADGTVRLRWETDAEPFAVTAVLDADQTYLPLNAAHRVEFQDQGGRRPFPARNHEALLTTDRGIYRPGEQLHAHALVRDQGLRGPEPFPVVLRLRKPDGRVLAESGQTLDRCGSVSHTFTLPDGAPTGRYTVESALPGGKGAPLGQTTVRVEDFAPPQLAVKLSGVAAAATAAVHCVTIQADYLFGRPAAHLRAEATAIFEAASYEPEGWQGWVFGDATRAFDPVVQRLDAQDLDAKGRASFVIEPDGTWRPPAAIRERVSGEVRDGAGRVVGAAAEGLVYFYPQMIGLRANPGDDLDAGQPLTVDVALVRPDGTPVAAAGGEAFAASVTREVWRPVVHEENDGRLTYRMVCEEIPVVTNAPVAFTGGMGRLTVALAEAGRYRVAVGDREGNLSTTLPLTVSAPGMRWWSWGGTRPDTLALSWDRACYATGEVARLLIKSPFAGTALIAIENASVLRQETVVLTNSVQEVAVPVDASYLPHVRCAVTVVRAAAPEEPWRAHRASGAIGLPLELSERRLAVACTAPKETRPGERLQAVVTVRDAAGNPISGRVVAAAVDEGVLQATGYERPDPLDWFLAARRSAMTGYDLFNQLLPEKAEEDRPGGRSHTAGDVPAEGDLAGQLSPVRGRRFKPVALWSGVLDLDAEGVARVGFDLPEFAGALRVMVLAYDRDRMGMCMCRVTVKRPHVLAVGLPRFLAPGDVCRLGTEVFNESGAPADIRLSVQTEGPVALADGAPHRGSVAAGGVVRRQWSLRADGGIGVARVTVRVEAGGERFEETTELPVRPASGRVLRTVLGRVAAGERKKVELPAAYAPQTLNWRLSLSGRQEVQLVGALQELLDYPYGCLEQTISRALPLVYLPDLAPKTLPGQITREETDRLIAGAISHVLAMRQSDGRFTMWGRGGDSRGWDWGTLYAAQFLAEASRAGYPVPEDELAVTLDAVERLLNQGVDSSDPSQPQWQEAMALKAHAAAVLTAAGHPPRGWIARLSEQSRLLRRSAAAQVAAACAGAGDTRGARAVLEHLGVPGSETRNGLNSEACTLALTLLAWCELEPAHPVAVEIVRRLNGLRVLAGWSTTQENALALLAMGRYAQLTAGAPGVFAARVSAAGEERTCSSGKPLLWEGKAQTAAAFEIANEGPAACFYALMADGVPLDPGLAETASGLAIQREARVEQRKADNPDRVEVGDALIVKLTLRSDADLDHLVIADLLPAGLELESTTLGDRFSSSYWTGIGEERNACWEWVRHTEVRDDRLVVFSGPVPRGATRVFYYRARAVTPGSYVWPAVCAEGMYAPEVRAASGARRLVVEEHVATGEETGRNASLQSAE